MPANSNLGTVKQSKDHLGNVYVSVKEMCKAYGIDITLYCKRRERGWSLKECLLGKEKRTKQSKTIRVVKDHLGNEYNSIVAMCKAYNVSDPSVFYYRKRKGWDLERCLLGCKNVDKDCQCSGYFDFGTEQGSETIVEGQLSSDKEGTESTQAKVKDHLGNEFKSVSEMCKVHGVKQTTYKYRKDKGLPMEECLKPHAIRDHMGIEYSTLQEMCDAYGVSVSVYEQRRSMCLPYEDCLRPEGVAEDHLGNKFASVTEMCKAYNLNTATYRSRRKSNWNLEECLLGKADKKIVVDHLGNIYKSVAEMCKSYNLSLSTYNERKYRGLTLEECLLGKSVSNIRKVVEDHLGNKFNTLEDMCEAYNVNICTYRTRVLRGWNLKDCLLGKSYKGKPTPVKDHLGNEYKSIAELCRVYNVDSAHFRRKLKQGLSIKDALLGKSNEEE